MEVMPLSQTSLVRDEPASKRTALPSHSTISRDSGIRLVERVEFNRNSPVGSTSPTVQSIGISSEGPSPSLNGSDRVYSKSPSPFDVSRRETPRVASPSPASASQGGQVCRYV